MPTCSKATVFCACIAFVYAIASLFYYCATRHIGTPFADSLTTEQRKLKAKSTAQRGRIFLIGIILGTLWVVMASPFALRA